MGASSCTANMCIDSHGLGKYLAGSGSFQLNRKWTLDI